MGASPLLAVAEIVLSSIAEDVPLGTGTSTTSHNVDELVSIELFNGLAQDSLNLIVRAASGIVIVDTCTTKENVS